jgi:hypothetical protein
LKDEKMSDEIAEFLRRAAQRRAEQMQQQLEAQRRAAQQQYAPPPPMPSAPPRPTLARPLVVEAEILEDEEPVSLRPARSNVAQHVAQHLDTGDFAERAERLGDATEQADERMEQHLHQAFDHRLGSIGASTESIMAAVTPEIDDEMKGRVVSHHPILSLLRQPQSVRNAIVLSELLQRPEQNWE